MKTFTILIADDEPLARQTIRQYIGDDPRFKILDDCEDGFSAIKSINQNEPDILFLDIQMPRINGFEVIELIDYKPLIVFSTAYDEFALKAFEVNAVDYLLKPYSRQRFLSALNKAVEKIQSTNDRNNELEKISETVDHISGLLDRIVVKDGVKIEIIQLSDVVFIESADDYVMINTFHHRFLKQKTMNYFETHLPSSMFLRVHRSFIVNLNYISKLEPYGKETWIAQLKGLNAKINISRSGYLKLKDSLRL